jgi:hypothetical protein
MQGWLLSSLPCDAVFTLLLGVSLVSFSTLLVGLDM